MDIPIRNKMTTPPTTTITITMRDRSSFDDESVSESGNNKSFDDESVSESENNIWYE